MKYAVFRVIPAVLITVACACADDWNQWRGPARCGVAPDGPPLVPWGTNGPAKLWQSEKIPSGGDGGFGCVSVSGGRAYLYVNWKRANPVEGRTLSEGHLRQMGWFPESLPEDLVKAMEAARVSDDRANLKQDQVKAWVDKWCADFKWDPAITNKLVGIVQNRLTSGKSAMDLAVLAKFATIRNKPFAHQAELDQWYADNAIPEEARKAAAQGIPTTQATAEDVILCLNAGDGTTLWKKSYPGQPTGWGSSSTPCVTGGRVVVAGTRTLYCLNAADGAELWKAPLKGGEISSSPLVVDGIAVILGGQLMGFDAVTGSNLWSAATLAGNNPSPTLWTTGGVNFVICNSGGGLACVESRTGAVRWTAPGGGSGSPVVSGNTAVVLSDNKSIGLVAYRMFTNSAEKIWSCPMADRGTTPIVWNGCVYVNGSGKTVCLSLADGSNRWEQTHGCEIASPLLADGKLLATLNGGNPLLMINAASDKYQELAKASPGAAGCSSPSLCAGRLYLRLNGAVVCYDLTKSP